MNTRMGELGRSVLAGEQLDREQAGFLAGLDGDDLYDLFYWANKVRLKHFGRSVMLCAIAAGKIGGCAEDCAFCSQSARHSAPAGRPGTARAGEEILSAARAAAGAGAHFFGIVNSGRAPTRSDLDRLADPITRIVASARLGVCASLGFLTEAAARRLVELGVRRYNHNLETSRRFFPHLVTTHSLDERIRTLRIACAAGMGLCSGGIFNVGEDWDDRLDMAMTLREIGPEVVPLNFLHPIPGTPLEDRPLMPPMEILKVVAIYRLLLPEVQIKMAGGREANLRDLQSWMFYCGASGCMVGSYLTTSGRPAEDDQTMIHDLGLTAAREKVVPSGGGDEGRAPLPRNAE